MRTLQPFPQIYRDIRDVGVFFFPFSALLSKKFAITFNLDISSR